MFLHNKIKCEQIFVKMLMITNICVEINAIVAAKEKPGYEIPVEIS